MATTSKVSYPQPWGRARPEICDPIVENIQ
uniref:Uncharacterized protein n=1 Tax=Arundo donax TaxID=35708 RepID=A0A0A8XXJ8_ARUDO